MARITKAQLEELVKELEEKVHMLEMELEEAHKAIDRLNARETELLALLRYRARVTPKLDRSKLSELTCVRCGTQVSAKVAKQANEKFGWTYCVACQAAAERYQAWQRQRGAMQAQTKPSNQPKPSNQSVKAAAKTTTTVKAAGLKCSACRSKVTPGVAKYSRDKFSKVLCMPCQRKVAQRRA